MKFGYRKPSFTKSFSSRTSGKFTRAGKSFLNPAYRKKGMGILHPKRKAYNAIYSRTTKPVFKYNANNYNNSHIYIEKYKNNRHKGPLIFNVCTIYSFYIIYYFYFYLFKLCFILIKYIYRKLKYSPNADDFKS